MFFRLTPFATSASDHPLFRLEARGVRNYSDFSSLRVNSVTRIGWTVAICLLLFAGYIVLNMTGRNFSYYYSSQQALLSIATDFTVLVVIVGVFSNAYLDFVCLSASMTAINGELVSGRWDLLRLAGMREGYFTVSKHGIAQLKAWRAVMGVVGLRLVGALSALIVAVVAGLQLFASIVTFNDALLVLGSIATLIVFAVVFCLEPIWRMRAITAVGLYVSARTRNPSYSPLLGFALVFGIWIVQFIIMFTVAAAFSMLGFPLVFLLGGLFTYLAPLIICIITAVAVYGFYSIIQNASLRRVALSLARLER